MENVGKSVLYYGLRNKGAERCSHKSFDYLKLKNLITSNREIIPLVCDAENFEDVLKADAERYSTEWL